MVYQLTDAHLDALQELINIGVGRAAGMLNQMLESRIVLEIPVVSILTLSQIQTELEKRFDGDSLAAVKLNFTGSFSGKANLVFPTDSAATLVSLLTGEEVGSPDLDSVKIGTLSEVGNIVINGIMGSISNVLNQHLNYAIPIYMEDCIKHVLSLEYASEETIFLLAQARFAIKTLEIIGDIVLIFEMDSFGTLIRVIDQQLEFQPS
ncbi:chemotaxis protein CheC [Dulcicalothrix desertica PCC 7102]|uniref:Chemotaxis protein CheC n=1 Tax=Dulcicalothrix desertica PCC 7102 TaxID=232991 RepID=A0A433V4R2_9CYAN|nr:chemotaxis protein CheC [Dulcicalothrix desertica]RUT01065.1 chemotaxis protein CheC [Dulcicalothrix desertica PCC 7102]TWH39161.1 chemotaxis protein CheC [Dulcicalothrix desertica PCC 7102]